MGGPELTGTGQVLSSDSLGLAPDPARHFLHGPHGIRPGTFCNRLDAQTVTEPNTGVQHAGRTESAASTLFSTRRPARKTRQESPKLWTCEGYLCKARQARGVASGNHDLSAGARSHRTGTDWNWPGSFHLVTSISGYFFTCLSRNCRISLAISSQWVSRAKCPASIRW